MTYAQFHNGIRVIMCLSGDEVLGATNSEDREFLGDDLILERFRRDPLKYFVACPTQDSEWMFAIIERKNKEAWL